jgi:signal transduction histidine kinase
MREPVTTAPGVNLDREHLEFLLEASRMLGSSLEVQAVVNQLMAQAVKAIGAERGFVLLEEEEVTAWHGLSREETRGSEFAISRGVVETVLRERTSVLTSDALVDERFRDQVSVGLNSLRSILCVPLIVPGGRLLGVLYADNRLETGAFGKRERALLEAVAAQAAVALENAMLYDQLRRLHETSMEKARRELAETQAQLLEASKMAAVGQLAAGVAHEINNPLGAIALHISALKQQLQDATLVKRLSIMDSAVGRCKSIVERLLRFSSRPTGPGKTFELSPLVEELAALVEPEMRVAGITLQWRVASGLSLTGEPQDLSQALLNLVLNARAALASRAEKRIWLEGRHEPGRRVLEVKDNGEGMTDEVRRRACEPFFSTRPVGQGVGLGLSLVYQMMQAQGGKLEIDSAPGQGTAVRLIWPNPS